MHKKFLSFSLIFLFSFILNQLVFAQNNWQESLAPAVIQQGLSMSDVTTLNIFYYKNPQPDKLILLLKALLSINELISDKYQFGSMAHLFETVAHKDKEFYQKLTSLKESYDGIQKQVIEEILQNADNFVSPSPNSPDDLDYLWSEFSATGNAEPIKKIISVLGLTIPSSVDLENENAKLIHVADWSLKSNAEQNKDVYKILQQEESVSSGQIKDWLGQIINEIPKNPTQENEVSIGEDIRPLYDFLKVEHSPEAAALIAKELLPMYEKFNISKGSQLVKTLKDNVHFIDDKIFVSRELKGNVLDSKIDSTHLDVISLLLGREAAKDMEQFQGTLFSNKEFATSFKCAYHSYLANLFLKAKGIKIDMIETRKLRARVFNDLPLWQEYAIKLNFMPFPEKKIPHVANIVWLDDDRFVVADFAQFYISPVYSWSKDLNHYGKKNVFKNSNVHISQFEIWNEKEILATMLVNFGNALNSIEKYDRALFYYEKALSLKSDFADACVGMASIFKFQKKYDEAEKYAHEALSYEINDSQAYNILAGISRAKGDVEASFENAKKCVQAEPDMGFCYVSLAAYYNDIHDSIKVKEYLNKAIKVYENNFDYMEANSVQNDYKMQLK